MPIPPGHQHPRATNDRPPADHSAEPPATGLHGLPGIAWVVLSVISGAFIWAGLAKAARPDRFAEVLYFLMPEAVRSPKLAVGLGALIASAEIALASALLFCSPKVWAVRTAIIALCAFSAVLLILAASPNAPGCGCFGVPNAQSSLAASFTALIRNAAMIGGLVWLVRWPLKTSSE